MSLAHHRTFVVVFVRVAVVLFCNQALAVDLHIHDAVLTADHEHHGESSPRLSRLVLSSHFRLPVRVSKCGAMDATS